MNKFNIGDKAILKQHTLSTHGFEVGELVTITEFPKTGRYSVKIKNGDGIHGYVDEHDLSSIMEYKFTKADLQERDRITLRNGSVGYYSDDMIFSGLMSSNINDDLTNNGSCGSQLDIVKVERPISYETIYERKEEPKKMTVKEICKELGYDVEIVK